VTFSSATVGDNTIPVDVADTHGKYATDAATFTLHVTRPNTPPTVTVGGVQSGAGYEESAVPAGRREQASHCSHQVIARTVGPAYPSGAHVARTGT
jgi:hypothetical protein